MKSSEDAAARTASTGSGLGGVLRRTLRAILLVVVLVLVAGIGLVVARDSPGPQLTATEMSLSEAAAAADGLASTAALLAESSSPAEADTFSSLTGLFNLHAAALELPSSHSSPTHSPSAAPAESASTPSDAPEPPTAAQLLSELTDSYTGAFDSATTAEPGPARLLASVGTSQWLQARELAEALAVEPPPAPVAHADYDVDAGTCASDATVKADPALEGTRAAVLAEHRASYAYEIVAARAPEPDPYLAAVAGHESAAAVGSAILTGRCVAKPLPTAAFALDERFLTEPDAALLDLEVALVGTYADLIGISGRGPARDWAIERLIVTAQRASSSGAEGGFAELGAFPGIDREQYPELSGVTS